MISRRRENCARWLEKAKLRPRWETRGIAWMATFDCASLFGAESLATLPKRIAGPIAPTVAKGPALRSLRFRQGYTGTNGSGRRLIGIFTWICIHTNGTVGTISATARW